MKTQLKMIYTICILFILGAVGYYLLEVAYRGFSHWTMGICGGICLTGIYFIDKLQKNILKKALIGTLMITAVEFLAGCIVNLWLDLGVWDYGNLKIHLLGQISLLFSVVWYGLSLLIFLVLSLLKRKKRILRMSIRNFKV